MQLYNCYQNGITVENKIILTVSFDSLYVQLSLILMLTSNSSFLNQVTYVMYIGNQDNYKVCTKSNITY